MTALIPNPGSTVPGFRMIDGNDIAALTTHSNHADVSVNITASGAIPIRTTPFSANTSIQPNGLYAITAASAAALTLAAPAVDDQFLTIYSATAFAHTITATGLLKTGSAAVNVITFAAFAGAGLVLVSKGGFWVVLGGGNAVTYS